MSDGKPKFAIIGCGGIGGPLAALMIEAGYDVTCVVHNKEAFEKIAAEGMLVDGFLGEHVVTPDGLYLDVADLPTGEVYDHVLLAMKATGVEPAARAVLPHLHDDSTVVSLQNGLSEETIAAIVGRERTIGCVVEWAGTFMGPGHLRVTSKGTWTLGELDGVKRPRLKELAAALETVYPARITGNILGHLWTKLSLNACITGVGAACGLYLHEMAARDDVSLIWRAIVNEAVAAGTAAGVRFERLAGKVNMTRVGAAFGKRLPNVNLLYAEAFFFGMTKMLKGVKSSSLQSLERGRKSEVGYLNGAIVEAAASRGLSAPVNAAVVDCVTRIEEGNAKIEEANLAEIYQVAARAEKNPG